MPSILHDRVVLPAAQLILAVIFLYAAGRDVGVFRRVRACLAFLAAFLRRGRRAPSRPPAKGEGLGLGLAVRADAAIVRGEKSWNHFHVAWGILSVVLLQIVNAADALVGYKVWISLADLVLLFYLCFFSSWFRNKIIGVVVRSQQKEETFQ